MVEFSETFKIECEEVDKDHRRLVDMVNEIVQAIDDGVCDNCADRVRDFVTFTKRHFAREEQLLKKSGYPDVGRHHAHHNMLSQKMEHLMEFASNAKDNEMARESLKKELVFFVMDDVITSDMDFKPYVSDKG